MSSSAGSSLLIAVLVFAGELFAGEPAVTLSPWSCTQCDQQKKAKIEMLRHPCDDLARICKLKQWVAIESPHFRIFSSLTRALVRPSDSKFVAADLVRLKKLFPNLRCRRSGSRLTPHQRAHLYHIRLERLYAVFQEMTHAKQRWLGMEAPYEVFLFQGYAAHKRIANGFLNKLQDKAGVRALVNGKPGVLVFTTAAALFGDDRKLHDNVRHHVTHNLANGYGNYYRHTWAFLAAGLAHLYEGHETDKAQTVCHAGNISRLPSKARWSRGVRLLVKRKQDRRLGRWCEKIYPHELTEQEHMLAWSLVGWMIETDPVRFRRLLDKVEDLEHKPTAAQAIGEVYGISPDALHERWRAYVLKSRPKR